MANEISSSQTNGVLLDGTYSSPTTIDSGVTIDGAGAPGGPASYNALQANSEWTIDNHGTLVAAYGGDGILLNAGGSVTNESDGQISGAVNGIYISGNNGSVDNFGSISGSTQGVELYGSSNRLTNESQATITGAVGVFANSDDSTIINDGVISGSNLGVVSFANTNYVANAAGATIAATNNDGVFVNYGGSATVENAGTITGGGGRSVDMEDGINRLVVTAGAVFNGAVYAGSGDTNTLELTTGAAVGTISQLGAQYQHFQTVTIDSGAAWDITGTRAGIGASTIDGFNNHDRIDLTDLNFDAQDTVTLNSTSDVLSIYGAGNALLDTIQLDSAATGHLFQLVDDGNGKTFVEETDFTPCFCRGTMILTAAGERPVESLAQGEMVLTLADGELTAQPVKWMGRRRIDLTAHPRPETVSPVRIQRGAFADGMPHSDLVVSPDHAIFVDGKLICARQLINGTTISQEKGWTAVEYFHVELEAHAILLAEGLPAESYLDTGNRNFFGNSDEPMLLHPDLTDETDCPTREAASCAPFVWGEDGVRPVWQTLADRAATLGQPAPQHDTTGEPDLCIVARGRTVKPLYSENGLSIFVLPKGTTEVRMVSRANAPTDMRPWAEDRRRLGVYVERISLRTVDDLREIPLDHPDLQTGWWAVEREGVAMRRWTDGDAALPLPVVHGATMLEVRAGNGGMSYIVAASDDETDARQVA